MSRRKSDTHGDGIDWQAAADDDILNRDVPLPSVNRRDFMKVSGIGTLGLLGSAGHATATEDTTAYKSRVTYYTDTERQAALENIEQYDWAKAERDTTVTIADGILDAFTSLDDFWNYVGSQHIPRAETLTNGKYYRPFAPWPWVPESEIEADTAWPVSEPGSTQWKITNGEYTLPTNDFEAYRQSGRDENGKFHPDLADDSLLVNEEHPELGETWGVDDGVGFVDEPGHLEEAGQVWTPVAWAHQWQVVYGYRQMVKTLFHAYLYTDDHKYARPVSVILDRLGDVYADFSLLNTIYEGDYTPENHMTHGGSGGTGQGKQVGSIFESFWVRPLLRSYDAVWPTQAGDSELVQYLTDKAETYPGLAPKDSLAAIRENIETGFIQEILPAVKNAQIRGNFGMHQNSLAISAVVQDDPDGYTADAIDFLFKAGDLLYDESHEPLPWYITGGNVLSRTLSEFDRDGWPNEASPHYNSIVVGSIRNVADVLNGYDGYAGADLYQNPFLKNGLRNQHPITFLNQFVPNIGDSGATGKPGFDELLDVDNFVKAFETYGGDELAQWTYLRNGNSADGLQGDIFDPDPQSVREELLKTIDVEGPLDLDSRQLAGYGFTGLRAGDPAKGTARGTWLYYGRNHSGPVTGGHPHRDSLNLGLFAKDLNLAPDLGYPDDLNDEKRYHWTSNTVSHNTVVVDEHRQDREWVCDPVQFDHTDRVQLAAVDGSVVYDAVDQYERNTAQVTVDDEDSYMVDFFRVTGGDDHHFSFHAAEVPTDSFEYSLREEVSEFVVRNGGGDVIATREAYTGDTAAAVEDTSGNVHDWRGLAIDHGSTDFQVETYIKSAVTGYNFYWHHNHAVYLGRDTDGRRVVAGVGNQGPDHDPRMGIYYPDSNSWGDYASIDKWEKDEWYQLSVSKSGTTVDIALASPDGTTTHSSGTFSLPAETDSMVGIFGGIGKGQTGRLYFDEFTLDGTVVEFFNAQVIERTGVETTGLDLTSQSGGTYAGPDIPYGDANYNDTSDYSGFNYLFNVDRDDNPPNRFSADWDVVDSWDVRADGADPVHLRLTMLTQCDDVALADGDAMDVGDLRYLLAHRSGSDRQSVFTSVIEPYEDNRFVESITEITVDSDDPTARAVKVDLANGRTDYIASASDHEAEHRVADTFRFVGAFALYSQDASGDHEHAYVNDGKLLIANGDLLIQKASGRIEGTVMDFTRDLTTDNDLQVRVTAGNRRLSDAVGSWIYAEGVDNEPPEHGKRNGAFRIHDIEDGKANTATLDVGEQTTVKDFIDPENPDAGYEYALLEDGDFSIPLSSSWSA